MYGYNLRVTTAGQYEITFVIPRVTITGVNGGVTSSPPSHTVTLVIPLPRWWWRRQAPVTAAHSQYATGLTGLTTH